MINISLNVVKHLMFNVTNLSLRMKVILIFSCISLLILFSYLININNETTNNATVFCERIDVVSELNGVVEGIHFIDNQKVKEGDFLIAIKQDRFVLNKLKLKSLYELSKKNQSVKNNDLVGLSITFDLRLFDAKSRFEQLKFKAESIRSDISEQDFNLKSINQELTLQEDSYHRHKDLYHKKLISELIFNEKKSNYISKKMIGKSLMHRIISLNSTLKSIEKEAISAEYEIASINVLKKQTIENMKIEIEKSDLQVEVAKSNLDVADLNLSNTRILARADGRIANRRISAGDYIEIGQPIASIVSCDENPWIEANFKEIQLGRMLEGQKVTFTVDTYSDFVFEGMVSSISNGSGSIFSVLPPENASGNFTKIVKRFPVKISINNDHGKILRMGSSATVSVILD